MKNNSARSAVLILLAGALWGTMGIFVRRFNSFGFDAMQVASLRLTAGAVIFIIALALRGGRGFRIAARDIPLFLGLGLGSVLFFTVCYFKSIEMMPLSIAAILLYTSPIWVTLMSVLFFKERLTLRRIAALILAFGGCVLVSGLGGEGLTPLGLLIGLCSGIGYGLYSILGSWLMVHMPPGRDALHRRFTPNAGLRTRCTRYSGGDGGRAVSAVHAGAEEHAGKQGCDHGNDRAACGNGARHSRFQRTAHVGRRSRDSADTRGDSPAQRARKRIGSK